MYLDIIVMGAVIGWFCKGSLKNLGNLPLKGIWLFIVLGIMELGMVFTQSPDRRMLYQLLIMGSAVILLLLLIINHRIAGVKIITSGLMLNFLVMAVNGGRMPVEKWAAIVSGQGDYLPELVSEISSRHFLMATDTKLKILADIIPLPPPYPVPRVISIGDIFIFAGIIILMTWGMSNRTKQKQLKFKRIKGKIIDMSFLK